MLVLESRIRRKYSWRTNQFVGKIRESLEGKGFERKRREDVSSGVENWKKIFLKNESLEGKTFERKKGRMLVLSPILKPRIRRKYS